jgi:REP element-mobilizing transposase RayT
MPTHFHFLVRIDTHTIPDLKKQIGIFLSSYAKAFNNAFQRNGSLFQQHTKAKLVDDPNYLITLLTYIHQNPIRAKLIPS